MHDIQHRVSLPTDGLALDGDLTLPDRARGIVAFAHGSGSSRNSPRNRLVAAALNEHDLGTLLFDLLTRAEERVDLVSAELRFDIGLLARRLVDAIDWLAADERTRTLPIGLFGASTGAAAALMAAAMRPNLVAAIVSRGGRPDLAGSALRRVTTPSLLIVGGRDVPVIGMNQQALVEMSCDCRLEIVPGATHLFEEAGALEKVARLAADWFERHLSPPDLRLPNGEPMTP